MSKSPLAIAVLISGTGSNLKALVDAKEAGLLNIDIRLVLSNRKDAPGLDHARRAGIAFKIIAPGERTTQDLEITQHLQECSAELVVLAGYMRIVGEQLVDAFEGKMINLHPALLPLYPGLDTYQRVLDAGDTEHGSSIHFVSAELDAGPVISQVRIPVLDDDDAQTLATRLGPEEHRLLLATVELFAKRRVNMGSRGVLLDGNPLEKPLSLNPGNIFE
jgi:phosphoribosylglycinamide formyltransferase-1